MSGLRRVGFVMDGMVPSLGAIRAGRCGWRGYLFGTLSASSCAVMRFGWVAASVNRRSAELGLVYEAYRSWRRGGYDALVFLKSMGPESLAIAGACGNRTRVVFDVNVDYHTPPAGVVHYEGMATTPGQRAAAMAMTQASDAVIADSQHLAKVWQGLGREVYWIPDNVDMGRIPVERVPFRLDGGKLTLLWSGEAVKLFDLLAIEDVLLKLEDRVRLVLVTSDLSALDRWHHDHAARFRNLLSRVEHEVVPFESIDHLLGLYASRPGIFISPRFLDNTYNLGHTEWKITLAMGCGRHVVCSEQPSYVTVSERADGRGIRICRNTTEWEAAFDEVLSGRLDPDAEGTAGREVVATHYATDVVAQAHADCLNRVLANKGSTGQATPEEVR